MTSEQLRAYVEAAKRDGSGHVVLVLRGKYPPSLPRGELLCQNAAGERVYRVSVARLVKRLKSWGYSMT